MAPEPSTRLNVSVRIARHAITAAACAPAVTAAWAAPPHDPVLQIVTNAPVEQVQQLLDAGVATVDHGVSEHRTPLYATEGAIEKLRAAGWSTEAVPAHPPPSTSYRMPDAGASLLRDLAAASDRAGHVVLGHSVRGRPIDALWLGQPPESGAPAHRILGAHHGDEYASFEVALAAAEAIALGDGADPQITSLLDQATIWVVPYVNPDGVVDQNRWNARSVDLNRNYDYEWSITEFLPGSSPFSEPESRAIRSFGHWVQPALSLSLHGGAANMGWVWNHTRTPAEDAASLEAQAARYAGQTTTPGFWITNGASWYITRGDTNDWSYGRHGVWDFTVELTEEKIPPVDEIEVFTSDHLPAVLDFVALLPDVSGRVIDAESGLPVDAQVELHDTNGPIGRAFRTEPGTGWFHRLVDSNATDVVVRATGFQETTVPIEDVAEIALLRAELDPRPLLPAPFFEGSPEFPEAIDGPVVLTQPGLAPIQAVALRGVLQIDPMALGAGAWTVQRPDGVVHRHALMVANPSYTSLEGYEVDGDTLRVRGSGFAPGTRVWALTGTDRARAPVSVIEEGPDQLVIDATVVTETTARVDLWILSGGEHSFLADVTDNDPDTWGMVPPRPRATGQSCACEVKTGHLPAHVWSWIMTPLLLIRRRVR